MLTWYFANSIINLDEVFFRFDKYSLFVEKFSNFMPFNAFDLKGFKRVPQSCHVVR